MRTIIVSATVIMCGVFCAELRATSKVKWVNEETALHFECDEIVVASCATMPEGQKYWAYCGWKQGGPQINGGAPKGYFDCKTNDSSGSCTLVAKAWFAKNYEDVAVTLVDAQNLSQAPSDGVRPTDPAVYALWSNPQLRKYTRYLHFDDIPGYGTLGNYTRDAKARFKLEVKSDGLLSGYTREGKNVTLSAESQMKTWIVWQVIMGSPGPPMASVVKKRYCSTCDWQTFRLYECRSNTTGYAWVEIATLPSDVQYTNSAP